MSAVLEARRPGRDPPAAGRSVPPVGRSQGRHDRGAKELCKGAGVRPPGNMAWRDMRIRSRCGESPGCSIGSAMSSGGCVAVSRQSRRSVDGIRRFMLFHGEGHPEGTGAVERGAFPTDLAVKSNVASSIRNHAPNAILFYRRILRKDSAGWRVRTYEEAGQATDRVHARRPSGHWHAWTGSEARWRAACAASGCGSWRMPAARQGRRFGQDPLQ